MTYLAIYVALSIAIGLWMERGGVILGEPAWIRCIWVVAGAVLWPLMVAWTVYATLTLGEDPEDLDW